MKAQGLVFLDKILKLHFKILFFDPMTYLFNYWTILVGDHPGTIPVEFGQRPISGSREPGLGQFWPQGRNFNNFALGPLDDVIY